MSKIYNSLKELQGDHVELEEIEILDNKAPIRYEKRRTKILQIILFVLLFFVSMFIGNKAFRYFKASQKEKVIMTSKTLGDVKSIVDKSEGASKTTPKDKVKSSVKLFVYRGNPQFVEELKKKFLEKPDDAGSANNLSVALLEQGKYEEALKYAERAIIISPDNAYFWNNLGVILTYMNLFEEAEKCFKKAIEINKEVGMFYYNLANMYERKGAFDLAQQNYFIYLSKNDTIYPDNLEKVRKKLAVRR